MREKKISQKSDAIVHAARPLDPATFCGIKVRWVGGAAFSVKTDHLVRTTRARRELTCRACERACV